MEKGRVFNGPAIALILAILNLGDFITTSIFLSVGLQEGNPITVGLFLHNGKVGIILWVIQKIAITAVLGFVAKYLGRRWDELPHGIYLWYSVSLVALAAFYVYVVVANSVGIVHFRILP